MCKSNEWLMHQKSRYFIASKGGLSFNLKKKPIVRFITTYTLTALSLLL